MSDSSTSTSQRRAATIRAMRRCSSRLNDALTGAGQGSGPRRRHRTRSFSIQIALDGAVRLPPGEQGGVAHGVGRELTALKLAKVRAIAPEVQAANDLMGRSHPPSIATCGRSRGLGPET